MISRRDFIQLATTGAGAATFGGSGRVGAEEVHFAAADVEVIVRNAIEAWQIPGVAVAIVKDDQPIFLKGFGVREAGGEQAVTPDTVFPLASCTKAFTTTLLAMLADDGVIGWDDPLRKHLPGFKLSDPNADALLTVRDLLCHRCGIAGHDLLWYHAPWGIDEVIRRAQTLPLEYPFRGGYRYSSIPFMAAGYSQQTRGLKVRLTHRAPAIGPRQRSEHDQERIGREAER